ncbi:MAG: PHP domain-containing protein [Promethearchaeota archaeon]
MEIIKRAKEHGEYLDLHIHTSFSIDVEVGNSFLDFMAEGERLKIIPGFLDHFQAEKLDEPSYPFNPDNIGYFLETYDRARETGLKSYLGLEIDYYDDDHEAWNLKTRQWLDQFEGEFDYFVGTIHDVFNHTVTIPSELAELLLKYDFKKIQKSYYNTLEKCIKSGMFDGQAHLDVIYRFCGDGGLLNSGIKFLKDKRTLALMDLCVDRGIAIELNIHGTQHPWKTTYPSEILLLKFLKTRKRASFFIGSDSHDLKSFKEFAIKVKKYNELLWNRK